MRWRAAGPRWAAATLVLTSALAGCRPGTDLPVPSAAEVQAFYESTPGLEAEVVGNVARLRVAQDPQQLRRGGSLWAKVGPYVYLFSEETRLLFEAYPGLAAVRVSTYVGGSEVANALLARDELSAVLWRRGLNIAGQARRDGTGRVTLLEDLVDWGEAHTDFEYNSRFIRR
jgi:hypothetical protein